MSRRPLTVCVATIWEPATSPGDRHESTDAPDRDGRLAEEGPLVLGRADEVHVQHRRGAEAAGERQRKRLAVGDSEAETSCGGWRLLLAPTPTPMSLAATEGVVNEPFAAKYVLALIAFSSPRGWQPPRSCL